MPLTIGSITVDDDGNATGSGLSLAIFNGALSNVAAEAKAKVAPSMKPFCEGIAAAIIDHFKDNGMIVVEIGTGDAGLQRTPDPNDPATATLAPSAPVSINGTIT